MYTLKKKQQAPIKPNNKLAFSALQHTTYCVCMRGCASSVCVCVCLNRIIVNCITPLPWEIPTARFNYARAFMRVRACTCMHKRGGAFGTALLMRE